MQVVVNALRMLHTVAEREGMLTLQTLAESLGMPTSSAHRLVTVLENEGYVTRPGATKHLILGTKARALVGNLRSQQISNIAAPHISELSRVTSETVFMTELVGGDPVCFAIVEGPRSVRFYVRQGTVLPLHATASGRVLLAYQKAEVTKRLIGGIAFADWPQAITTNADELENRLHAIVNQGYETSTDEMDDAAWAVAAPVFAQDARIVATVTLICPARDQNEPDKARAITETLAAAKAISADLGAAR